MERADSSCSSIGRVTCHATTTRAAASLAGLFGTTVEIEGGARATADDSYIRESILTPQTKIVAGYQPLMPTFQGQVNEEGVMGLIEFIKSKAATARPQPGTPQANAAPTQP